MWKNPWGGKNVRARLLCKDRRPFIIAACKCEGEAEPSVLWRTGGNLWSLLEKEIIGQHSISNAARGSGGNNQSLENDNELPFLGLAYKSYSQQV